MHQTYAVCLGIYDVRTTKFDEECHDATGHHVRANGCCSALPFPSLLWNIINKTFEKQFENFIAELITYYT